MARGSNVCGWSLRNLCEAALGIDSASSAVPRAGEAAQLRKAVQLARPNRKVAAPFLEEGDAEAVVVAC